MNRAFLKRELLHKLFSKFVRKKRVCLVFTVVFQTALSADLFSERFIFSFFLTKADTLKVFPKT